MMRKVLKIETGSGVREIEYWKLGEDAFLVEQKALLIFVNTKLGEGLSVLPVKSEKIAYSNEILADIKKAFTDLHQENLK
jgi:hypothetical protein